MSDVKERCLETFPTWLRTLAEDAEGLLLLVETTTVPEGVRRTAAAGIDDIGFLDDAFVMRLSAEMMGKEDPKTLQREPVGRLAADCALIREFLGPDYSRLEGYVQSLRRGAARGRSVQDIVSMPEIL